MTTSDDYLIGVLLKLRGRARLEGLVTTLEESTTALRPRVAPFPAYIFRKEVVLNEHHVFL